VTGPWPCPSESSASAKRYSPGGISALKRWRTAVLVRSSSWSNASRIRSGPKRANSSTSRRSPNRIAAIEARVSPCTIAGKRELRVKTRQVEPLGNLDKKVITANGQIADFYKKRFPAQDSQIATQLGQLAAANGVAIDQARYKVEEPEVGHLQPIEMEAQLSGNYVSLAKFINAMERDEMFFIIDAIALAGEQKGPIKLQLKFETYLKAGT